MTERTKTSFYFKDLSEIERLRSDSLQPIEFKMVERECRLEDTVPIRSLSRGFELVFDGPDFEEMYLFNFRLETNWPAKKLPWNSHAAPSILNGLHECTNIEESFVWRSSELPQDLKSHVRDFLEPDQQYVIVEFDILARRTDGEWIFVDPGIGIKP
jgi:hypothetical protein